MTQTILGIVLAILGLVGYYIKYKLDAPERERKQKEKARQDAESQRAQGKIQNLERAKLKKEYETRNKERNAEKQTDARERDTVPFTTPRVPKDPTDYN